MMISSCGSALTEPCKQPQVLSSFLFILASCNLTLAEYICNVHLLTHLSDCIKCNATHGWSFFGKVGGAEMHWLMAFT